MHMNEVLTSDIGHAYDEEQELRGLRLDLLIEDPETIAALASYPEGRDRNRFVRTALRIGIIALNQAQGRIDTESVRNEGDRLVREMEGKLADYRKQTENLLANTLKDYFDPQNGRFNERVERLVRQDGDLEKLMRAQVGQAERFLDAENSALARMKRELAQMIEAKNQAVQTVQTRAVSGLEAMRAKKAAAGARAAIEIKEAGNHPLKSTLEEIDTARKNREAGVGFFIHSRRTAPAGLEPLARYGNDIVVTWDTEDETTDAWLKAGLLTA